MSDFWDENAGITATAAEASRASAANAAAQALTDSSSLAAAEVAELLHLPLPAIERSAADKALYSYTADGIAVFPAWQFTDERDATIPSLWAVLQALPDNLHPQAVAGFFLTPQPDLVLNGSPVSAKVWLEAGGDPGIIIALAEALASGW